MKAAKWCRFPKVRSSMGSKDGDPDEAPEHQVFLKASIIDKKEVTQGRICSVCQNDEAADAEYRSV